MAECAFGILHWLGNRIGFESELPNLFFNLHKVCATKMRHYMIEMVLFGKLNGFAIPIVVSCIYYVILII